MIENIRGDKFPVPFFCQLHINFTWFIHSFLTYVVLNVCGTVFLFSCVSEGLVLTYYIQQYSSVICIYNLFKKIANLQLYSFCCFCFKWLSSMFNVKRVITCHWYKTYIVNPVLFHKQLYINDTVCIYVYTLMCSPELRTGGVCVCKCNMHVPTNNFRN